MKQTKVLMGMPITVEVVDDRVTADDFASIFSYFNAVDKRFSTYKKNSEISKINSGRLSEKNASRDMKEIFSLSEKTKKETNGYFNIENDGMIDPSGIVKGWAIQNAAALLKKNGFTNFYIDAGGDIQVCGKNAQGKRWTVGIKNPFNENEIVKILQVDAEGVATSGIYIRGNHIYNPHHVDTEISDIVSLTVVGPNIFDADRFATAAFAMGKQGIVFIEKLSGFEGYIIDKHGIATMTSGFSKYVKS